MVEARASRLPLRVAVVDPSDQRPGSMSRYACLVSAALEEAAPGRVAARHVRLGLPQGVAQKVPAPLRTSAHHVWVVVAALLRRGQVTADVVHLVDGSHGYLLSLLPGPRVATVHDVIPLLQMRGIVGGRPPSTLARQLISSAIRGLRLADRIVADSEATARDLERHAGLGADRVEVVPLAPDAAFTEGPPWSPTPWEGVPFILHVGSDAFYKNRTGVLRVFSRLRASHPLRLVMVGPRPDVELEDLMSRHGLSADVAFRTEIDDAALAELYRHAALLLFPSLHEGFGWPVLEAMSVGCPVVCSDVLSELAADGALLVPAGDDAALAAACAAILDDPAFARDLSARARHRAAVFSRVRMGTALIACYEAAARVDGNDAHPR